MPVEGREPRRFPFPAGLWWVRTLGISGKVRHAAGEPLENTRRGVRNFGRDWFLRGNGGMDPAPKRKTSPATTSGVCPGVTLEKNHIRVIEKQDCD